MKTATNLSYQSSAANPGVVFVFNGTTLIGTIRDGKWTAIATESETNEMLAKSLKKPRE